MRELEVAEGLAERLAESGAETAAEAGAGERAAGPPAVYEARLARLLAREGAALRRVVATYVVEAAAAEDLFQDVCLALWQALPRFRGKCSERTFAFRIAHNRALSTLARRRRATDLAAVAEAPDPRPSPETVVASRQRREQLRVAVGELPLALRQPLTLALEGMSGREISEVLGISEGNVAVRLSRARQALRDRLGEPRRTG